MQVLSLFDMTNSDATSKGLGGSISLPYAYLLRYVGTASNLRSTPYRSFVVDVASKRFPIFRCSLFFSNRNVALICDIRIGESCPESLILFFL